MKSQKFLATIYRIWMMRHVDVPQEISRALATELSAGGESEDSGRGASAGRDAGACRGKGAESKRGVRTGAGHQTTKAAKLGKPAKAAKQSKSKLPKYIPVMAIVNGRSTCTTLVPAGDGRYRLQINTALRKAAHADVGDAVSVELRLDLASRELPVPADLRAALKEHPKARKAFEQLAPGHRRQFIQWFDSAKAPETRIRRLGRAIDVLLERAILGSSNRSKSKSKSV